MAKELTVNSLGELYWLKPGHLRPLYTPVGNLRSDGYRAVSVNDRLYLAHKIVWCLTRGRWPVKALDHINGKRDDNRPENLREVTNSQNRRNIWAKSKSASGVYGVNWIKRDQRWKVHISDNGIKIYLGYFSDLQDAIDCRRRAEKRLGYETGTNDI